MQHPAWRLILAGSRSGAQNMEADEALARQVQDGTGAPALRLYRWSPPAISLGHHQREADIDTARAAADGIDVVRRPTGGRAILHADELTYCVVMPTGRRGVLDVYNDISRALVRGLSLFGVDVELQKSQPDFNAAYRHASSIPCFSSSARYEIEWQGRKLVGSAQRRFSDGEHDAVLQHGSILCGPAHQGLARYLAVSDPDIATRVREDLERRTADLSMITGRSIDHEHLTGCIRRGFELAWGITFSEEPEPCQHSA